MNAVPMPNMCGKVALITGASSGIGKATAAHFVSLGCRSLSITARNATALDEVAAQCMRNSDRGVEVLVTTCDIWNTEAISAIIKHTAEHFGRIDIVVNCAGSATISRVGKIPLEEFDAELNTNLRSMFHITQEVLPYLKETKGNIVNVSSIGTMRPVPSVALAGISKATIDALTRLSAVEYAPYGIRVNSINPGPIERKMAFREEMSAETQKTLRSRMEKSNLMGRIGTVEAAAHAIAFLASDNASFITGHSLPVDGGTLLVGPIAPMLPVKKGADQPTAN
ncbi:3-oxoacyl-[acyl-carrier-protein] reductase FabG-like isoform X1 [Dermacentor variabilis]|uniref:3-oxoacyl-[acyl-carrier-protein] reductase FabG-like isoform X1 n=2 Tax=Dermacentor variabilis TaxID=34621 RepID=UPI003F5C4E1E